MRDCYALFNSKSLSPLATIPTFIEFYRRPIWLGTDLFFVFPTTKVAYLWKTNLKYNKGKVASIRISSSARSASHLPIAILPDKKILLLGNKGRVIFVRISNGKKLYAIPPSGSKGHTSIYDIAIPKSAQTFFVARYNTITIYCLKTRSIFKEIRRNDCYFLSLAIYHDETLLLTGDRVGSVLSYKIEEKVST